MGIYHSIRAALKNSPAYSLVRKKRAANARRALAIANIYPDSRDKIIEDYLFSIERDFRDVMQIVNIEECVRHVVSKSIGGAFVETGVFTGGASAYALRCLLRNEPLTVRKYWGFDSFQGMPQPTEIDGEYAVKWMYGKSTSEIDRTKISGKLEPSRLNLSDYEKTRKYLLSTGYAPHLLNLVKGWFQHTLPTAKAEIGPIAILRLDGDYYESTKVVLEELYDQVVVGGIVIIYDYGIFEGCKKAVDGFLAEKAVDPFIHYVENSIRFFVKPAPAIAG